jgi:alpha-L-rhamnosidase
MFDFERFKNLDMNNNPLFVSRLIPALLILFTSCTVIDQKETEITFPGEAKWITDKTEQPTEDSLFYLDDPSPLFRKEFNSNGKITSAQMAITAAGYYRASINGERVGDHHLDPAWSNYSERVYYSVYDVSELIGKGENCLGVTLGNGFYNPLPLRMWGGRNIRNDLPVGRPAFICKLLIEYENGTSVEVSSDESWKFDYGPMLRNNVYLGEIYDAGKEIPGWDKPGFDEGSWKVVTTTDGPGGNLQEIFFPPIRITGEFEPVDIYSYEDDKYIVDLGVNITGTYRINMKGSRGDTVVFRFGERIYDDGALNPMTTVCGQIKRPGVGGPGAPDIAWQTDSYIFGSDEEETYEPEFTFHVYRYMEIKGLDYKPAIEDITGLALNSDVEYNGNFECSSELLNSIQAAVERTFLDNIISVQSDCPAREKFGYGGDLNATNESFIYNFDMQEFYTKTIYDWVDAIKDSTFVDTAPFVGIKYCGLSWESAFLITQYFLYLYYDDIELVNEMYDFNVRWMDKAAMIHPDGIVEKGLSDHESMMPVPVKLTGTGHYLQCARIMEEFAGIMGDTENQSKYSELAIRQVNFLRNEFWDKPVEGRINRQTLFATLLYHDIIPEDEIPAARDSLLRAVNSGISGHFTTGIFGTKYILETMSEFISPEKVFEIVNSTQFPGWGFMMDNGATTIWETWKESDNTFSNCHPMFGMVTEWFYRWLGGIRPDPEHPGFEQFIINPATPEGLDHVNCSYDSPHGKIVSNWKREDDGIIFKITVPDGSKAELDLPAENYSGITLKKNGKEMKAGEAQEFLDGKHLIDSGEYLFKVYK